MDATVSIPLHFTLEVLGLAAAGLLVAWSSQRDTFTQRWPVGTGALAFGVAQALHGGAFIEADDEILVIVLRFAGLAGLIAGAFVMSNRDLAGAGHQLYAAGVAGVFGGALWGSIAGGTVDDLVVGAHVLTAAGSLALIIWGWRASRPQLRLRVLASFIVVLTIAIVVSGGAVARVSALDKRNAELDELRPAMTSIRQALSAAAVDLTQRAADLSPRLAGPLQTAASGQSVALPDTALADSEGVVLFDRGGAVRATRGAPADDLLARSHAFQTALEGRSEAAFLRGADTMTVAGVVPVFRPGGSQAAADVIGIAAVLVATSTEALQRATEVLDQEATLSILDPAEFDADALGSLSVSTRLPNGPYLVVSADESQVVDATTGLLRALLIALLASAFLAVITASWLSVRIARPMLDLADEAERVKTDFLANISHELRTPLTPIRGYTEILQRGRVPSARATGYIDEIGQAAQRMERIVTLLVDVASLEAGRLRLDVQPVAVTDLTDGLASTGGRIEVQIPRTAPKVRADADLITRVLGELVDNAAKFSPPDGTITVGARRTNRGVQLSVSDQGPGIEPERLAALSSAFAQAAGGDTREHGGLGLGLTFVKGVLDLHGTTLVVKVGSSGGTTVSFVLPAAGSVGRVRSAKR